MFCWFKKNFRLKLDGLLYKPLKIGIGGKIFNITQSLYTNSKCAVKVNDHRTAFFRQGCSLSPTLFNIYMNDLAPLSGKQKPVHI